MDSDLTRRCSSVAIEAEGQLRGLASWIARRGCISNRPRTVDVRWANVTGPVPTVDGLVRFANNGAILGRAITSGIDVNRLDTQLQVDLGRRRDAAGGEH